MKIRNMFGILAGAFGLLLLSGCVAMNSGNVANAVKNPLLYQKGEEAVVIKETTSTYHTDGKVHTVVEKTTKTGLQVNQEDRKEGWQTARVVGTAKAGGDVRIREMVLDQDGNLVSGGGYSGTGNVGGVVVAGSGAATTNTNIRIPTGNVGGVITVR